MITLIGTGHVFSLSQALLNIFDDVQPDFLCVELDKQRYNALMMKQTNPEAHRDTSRGLPIVYKLLAKFQEGMAKEYGVTPGEEMLTTINYAQSHQLPLAFIDMNAQILFKKMLRSMTFKEKIRLMLSGIGGLFVNKKRVEKELDKLEDNFDKYIDEVSKKFPTIKRVLIDERNQYMVQQLVTADEQYEKIITVVGDGHIPGLSELLEKKEIEFKVVRLSELRNQDTDAPDSATGSFTIEHKEP